MQIEQGQLSNALQIPSPFFNQRPDEGDISLLVIHNISLPAGQFGGPHVAELFTGQLDAASHPSFEEIHLMQVSAHCFIRRDGQVVQFVNFLHRAWHAGVSQFQGRKGCNDFSIGIELEGTDTLPYTDEQYTQLVRLTHQLQRAYPRITLGRIVGHCDIAPNRKTDPGVAFDWSRYRTHLG